MSFFLVSWLAGRLSVMDRREWRSAFISLIQYFILDFLPLHTPSHLATLQQFCVRLEEITQARPVKGMPYL
jgi:hypothetical protein